MPKRGALFDSFPVPLDQLGHTDCGVMGVDANQKILLWNRAAENILGSAAKQTLGKFCHEVLQCEAGNGALICRRNCSPIQQARRRQWPSHQLLRIRGDSRRDSWMQMIVFSLFSPRRELRALLHVFWITAETPVVSVEGRPAAAQTGEDPTLLWLSRRERQVLRCMAAGMATRSIATVLFISPVTVRNHTQNILRKLGVHSRLEAVALATRQFPA